MYTGTESIPQKEASKARFLGGDHLEKLRASKGLTPSVVEYRGQDPEHREAQILIISLRSGSGLDGLQHVCHTVVHGELDWSPAPHDQGDGRLDRPGQENPVLSYRPFCDYGTDPLMLERLAEKRQQGEGITTPDKGIFEPSNADPDQIRKVAAQFLAHAGHRRQEKRPDQLEMAAA
jgi:SNF2 family DNA or RNA helicase